VARQRPGRDWAKGRVNSTADVANTKLNILLWGKPGTGKTHFIGTAPRPFVIAAENGTLTLHKQKIPYIQLTDDMAVFDWVMQIIKSAEAKEKIEDDDGNILVNFAEVDTIAVDSIWKLNEMLLEELCEKSGKGKATFDEWGMLLSEMSKIIGKLIASDYHIICTNGEAIKTDQLDESEKTVEFNMRGSYRTQIAYEFDFNLYMVAKSRGARMEYIANTVDENKRTAKSRVKLEKSIKDPDFGKLHTAVIAGLTK